MAEKSAGQLDERMVVRMAEMMVAYLAGLSE